MKKVLGQEGRLLARRGFTQTILLGAIAAIVVLIVIGLFLYQRSQLSPFKISPKAFPTSTSEKNVIEVRGVLEMPSAQWSPSFDEECFAPSPIIKHLGQVYYLVGICPFHYSYGQDGFNQIIGQEVLITGVIEEKTLVVPLEKTLNSPPPTKKETFQVINVQDIRLAK